MRTLSIVSGLAAALIGVAAAGQTLQERVDAVREQAKAQNEAEAARKLTPAQQILQKLYYTKVSLEFDEMPAREAFEYLATLLDTRIVGRYSDDPQGFGIDPEAPITLDVEETRALDVLEMMLEQCQADDACTWQLRRGMLEVGTRERLAETGAQELRIYPVDDLLFDPPDFHDAPSLDLRDQVFYGHGYGYGGYSYPYGVPYGVGYGGGGPTYFGGRSAGAIVGAGGAPRADEDERRARATELIELIIEVIEPDMWVDNGGTGASIAYRDGALVIRAPDFIHRQIGGYPKVPAPVGD